MNPQRVYSLLSRHRLSILQFVFPALLLALCIICQVTSTAQSLLQDGAAGVEERTLEDKIPSHLPIKIKVKNLNNERWLRDLQIEVKNTGEKPIYYLRISLFFIDVKKDAGGEIGYPLVYGRHELIKVGNHAGAEDVPIQPGETYTFTMPETYIKGWEHYRTKVEKKPHPKKVGIRFHVINFGDGTGFVTTGGLPVPEKISFNGRGGEGSGTIKTAIYSQLDRPPTLSRQLSSFFLPAYFLPVNFYPAEARI